MLTLRDVGATDFRRTSPDFERAIAELAEAVWRPGLIVEEIGSPQRIAPYSIAIAGDLTDGGEDVGSGRLILLHDPAGNEAWQGTFRCVTFARAHVDLEMAIDPMLPEVGWSWLTDALNNQGAEHDLAAGTVTAVYSQSFGAMRDQEDTAEVEIRASWTPFLGEGLPLQPHLAAWQDLLTTVAGLPLLPPDVVALRPVSTRR